MLASLNVVVVVGFEEFDDVLDEMRLIVELIGPIFETPVAV